MASADDSKQCKRCEEWKPITDFYRFNGKVNTAVCKFCKSIEEKKRYPVKRDKVIARVTKWQKENRNKGPDDYRPYSFIAGIKYKYGMTLDQYHALNEKQDFCCAICGACSELDIDHDHETNKVRGLLCNNCNTGIGMLQDNVMILYNAANYLMKGAA